MRDEPIQRFDAVDCVEDAGFEAVEAASAEEAIRILEARPDIRVVFTDIDMPRGIDGMKLRRRSGIAGRRSRSSSSRGGVGHGLRTCRRGGVFFAKPYKRNEIAAMIHG